MRVKDVWAGSEVRRWLCLIWLLCVAGCSDSTTLDPLGDNATVLAFGDSLTAGVGVSSDSSYPHVLSELIDRSVINAGVSGETTQEGRERLGAVLAQHQPDLLILLEGGNDILRNQSLYDTEQNLAAMIELAKARSVPVLLIGVPEKSLFSYSAPLYESLAKRYSLPYDGRTVGELMRNADMKSDPIHFNQDGYRELAAAIAKLMRKSGAL